ncbi:inorganic phosphate transporter [Salinilacihabitans rarus]|uniref:inorganic phosphate transporter n=1 Tax=Salinilacihabitans rarus TaxID=2961596 RepID=UPI0020C90310|nr:inorganic phosphate transporter [Salinilacihabitans rarus]
MELTTLVLFLLATAASAFMAWVIGAGSSGATPFAPAVGANAISTMRAAFVVGVFGFLGAATQGGNVSDAVGRGLVTGVELPAAGVIVALAVGAGLMAVGIYTGYPIATAFTVTGAVVGVGLALGGDPAWPKYRQIGAMWALTPVVGGGIAYGLASLLPRSDVPERVSVPLLGALVAAVLANLQFTLPGASGSLAGAGRTHLPAAVPGGVVATVVAAGAVALALRQAVVRDQAGALRGFLLALGALVAFSAGGSQVGLAVGPLLPLLDQVALPATAALAGGGLGLLIGSWTGAPRMIKSLSQDYSSLGPRRSISTLVPSFLIAQTAVLIGVPVSFNQIVVSAIVGSGYAVGGRSGVSRRKLLLTGAAWAGSFVVAFVVGYVAMIAAAPA